MQEEYDWLMAIGTWGLIKFLNDCKIVGCKWVFRTTKNALGEIVRQDL